MRYLLLKRKKGQSIVEFALLMPILVLLVMAILEFGLLLNTYLAMNNAAREGARTGIAGATDAQIITAVQSTSPTLKPAYMTVTITPSSTSRVPGSTLHVTISYQYHTLMPIIGNIISQMVGLSAQTSMRME